MSKVQISASIMSADLLRLEDEILAVLEAGAHRIHFDVMDQHYVPNLTFGPDLCQAILKRFKKTPVDVHLMVAPLTGVLDAFIALKPACVFVHIDVPGAVDALRQVKDSGVRAGVALKPDESISEIESILPWIDDVLLMGVNPGFSGQTMVPVDEKLQALVALRSEHHFLITVDGGVDGACGPVLTRLGADILVSSSFIFRQGDYEKAINVLF